MKALQPTAVWLLLLCTLPAFAQTSLSETTPETAPTAAPVPEPAKAPVDISGYADLYYRYADNEVGSVTSFTETHAAFSLGMVNLLFSKQKGNFGFVGDLGFGPRAISANGNAGSILAAVKQLYITYAPSAKLKLTAGNFATFVGYESIDPTANAIYSTSYMFSKGPFCHTGLKADYAFSDKLSGMVGVFNDTDSKFDDVKGKHVGAQLAFLQGGFKTALNYLGGREDNTLGSKRNGHQLDLTTTWTLSPKWSLGLNASEKMLVLPESNRSINWKAAALYANYSFSDLFALSFRGEVFDDSDAVIFGIAGNQVTEFTLAGNIRVDGFTLIPEIRLDSATEPTFNDGKDGLTKSVVSALIAAVYKF